MIIKEDPRIRNIKVYSKLYRKTGIFGAIEKIHYPLDSSVQLSYYRAQTDYVLLFHSRCLFGWALE